MIRRFAFHQCRHEYFCQDEATSLREGLARLPASA
jgi:hypothetical protein